MNEYRDSENSHVQQIVLPAANRLLIEAACRLAPVIPLADVAFVRMGQSPPGQSNNAHGEGTPLLGGPADLGAFCPFPTRWTTSPTSICAEGDILVCVRATIGEPRWSDGEYCIGRGLSAISPKNQDISSKYLFHVIKGNQEKLKKKGTGTTFKTIRKEDLEQIPVPQLSHEQQEAIGTFLEWLAHQDGHMVNWDAAPELPDEFSEQRRIVERIEGLATKVEAAHRLKETTKYETDRFWKVLSQMARSTPYAEKELGEIVEFLDGRRIPLRKADREKRRGPYPYYGASGIIDYIDDYLFDEDLLLLSEDGANLVNRSTPIAFIASGKYWVNNHAHVLKPLANVVDLYFLAYALADYDVGELNFASAQAKLNQKNARSITIPLPPLDEQKKIVKYLDRIRLKAVGLVDYNADVAAELDALMPSILDKAFKGEL